MRRLSSPRDERLCRIKSDPEALTQAVMEVQDMLADVKHPAPLVGAEVHRFHMQDELAQFIERLNNIPRSAPSWENRSSGKIIPRCGCVRGI